MAAKGELSASPARSLGLLPGESLQAGALLDDGRTLVYFTEGDGVRAEVIDLDGARRVLLRRETSQLPLTAWDSTARRLVISVSDDPMVFDLDAEVCLGRLPDVTPTLWELRSAGVGRVMGSSSDGWRRLWDLKTMTVVTRRRLRWYKGWTAPVGLLPGDPTLTCLSFTRQGHWVSALVNAHTGRDLARHRLPARTPAHHDAAPVPDRLEWVGVLAEGASGAWGPSRIYHFTSAGARLIDEEPMFGRLPGVVRIEALTPDWLYTDGWRDPMVINLRTGVRRSCPWVGKVRNAGLVTSHRSCVVYDLETGALAPLYLGDAPDEGRSAQSISADGSTALVSTPDALEWWAIRRAP
jgi:hypothetical protein